MTEPEVFAQCVTCNTGAVYVPEVGPMGDEFCTTIEEAIATRQHWLAIGGEFMCPTCVDLGEGPRLEAESLGVL